MRVLWTPQASSDVLRVVEFLRAGSRQSAARVARVLLAAPKRLADHPRIGELVEHAGEREIRKIFVSNYEIRYEVRPDEVWVSRIFHMRENR